MKRSLLLFFLICTLFSPANNYGLDESAEELRLYLGEVKVLPVNNPTRIVISNPKIVDVSNVDKDVITLNPKAAGATTLVYWDNFGEQSFQVNVFAENMQDIKLRIDNLLGKLNLPNVYTQAADEENKVFLLGKVKTPQEKEKLVTALGNLKDKIVDLVEVKEVETTVEIDVQILELNKDATDTLGFSWPGGTGSLTATDSSGSTTTAGAFENLLTFNKWTRSAMALTWKLDLLIQEGKARVLSRPRLACQSGKEAELLVGGEKPVLTTTIAATTGAQGTEVEYKEFGIKLKIKPTVTEDERIKLGLNVEVSDVGAAEFLGETGNRTAQAYPLSKRNASTELYLNDGETMAIGGLIKQKSEEDLRKFPWLADVPVLGMFFRQRVTKVGGGQGERGNTELFITLTPKILPSTKEETREEVKAEPIETVVKAAPITTTNVPEHLTQYAQLIQKRIGENLIYPASAKRAGFQGTTKLSLRLSYRGKLLDIRVRESSGYKILDENAISAAKSISTYPPFPPSVQEAELQIDIPITYQLN